MNKNEERTILTRIMTLSIVLLVLLAGAIYTVCKVTVAGSLAYYAGCLAIVALCAALYFSTVRALGNLMKLG